MKEVYFGHYKGGDVRWKYLQTKPGNLDNPLIIPNEASQYELQYIGLNREINGVSCQIIKSIYSELINFIVILSDDSFRKLIEADSIRHGVMIADFHFIYSGMVKLSLKD